MQSRDLGVNPPDHKPILPVLVLLFCGVPPYKTFNQTHLALDIRSLSRHFETKVVNWDSP